MTTLPSSTPSFMPAAIRAFIDYKRALGCHFKVEEATLRLLERYLADQHIDALDQITPELLTAFLSSRPRRAPRSYNHLLSTVRRFFNWMVIQGRLAQSPAIQLKPRRQAYHRVHFILNAEDARRLLDIAGELPENSRAPMRGMIYRTIFALLFGLGLRVGEVCHLCLGDVDFERRLLVIRQTKFNKSRLVPFGPHLAELLRHYLVSKTQRAVSRSPQDPLFSFLRNQFICPETISQTFHALVPRLNLQIPPGVPAPRLHDLRHSFAVGTLLRWYRSGINPTRRLLRLSTFLGHVNPASTAVYLNATDELLREAGRRYESYVQPCFEKGGR